MNYEKKYNEAFEKAKKEYKGAVGSHCDVAEAVVNILQGIFPQLRESETIEIPFGAKDSELKGWEYTIPEGFEAEIKDGKVIVKERESEDERIRRELCSYLLRQLGRQKDNLKDSKFDKWISWLQKQKEPHIPWYDYQKSKQAGYTIVPNDEYEQLIKQKEQKPAEWSEEDKEMLVRCIAAIPVQGDEIMPTSYLNKLRDWLETLSERFNLQPKQEWSEEDEVMLKCVMASVRTLRDADGACVGSHYDFELDWLENRLKSLRPSWKPKHCWEQMEWTDTDLEEFTENVRYIIVDKLTTVGKDANGSKISSTVAIDDKTAREIANAIIFCIGPQPHWKPSEEQPKVDYNEFEKLFDDFCERNKGHHITSHDACMWFWELGLNTRK